ncbi:MAG TPA: hypothetical protein VGO53_12540, partial [Steroidobacteraceae bacterium]|nr:hypothetical protein [Steroidobacteraceae bacterium]
TATIQDLMQSEVDPSADFLWDSVAIISSPAGIEERQPRTEEEWKEARHRAITLAEAANLLVMEGRHVAAEGKALEDSHVEGILTAPKIQQIIDSDRGKFIERAHVLHDAGLAAIAAIDSKSPAALIAAGAAIDEASEQCHLIYWYPTSPRPTPTATAASAARDGKP